MLAFLEEGLEHEEARVEWMPWRQAGGELRDDDPGFFEVSGFLEVIGKAT